MKSKYLQSRNMMYMYEATDDFEPLDPDLKMGCIAQLCAKVKNGVVRQFRKVDVSSHGVKVFHPLASELFCSLSICISHEFCLLSRTSCHSG